MADLKPIIDAVMSDAESAAHEIARKSSEKISEMKLSAQAQKENIAENAERALEEEIRQSVSAAEADARQRIKSARLAARYEAVENAVRLAVKKLPEKPEYAEFMKKNYDLTGRARGTVYMNERDAKRYGSDIFEGCKISGDYIDAAGGFILDCGNVRYDCTIESLFEDRKDKIFDTVNRIFEKNTDG